MLRCMTWARAVLNGVELSYEEAGEGEPVLLIHGSPVAGAFDLLARQPAVAERHRIVHYQRRGYARALPKSESWASMEDQAADAAALLRHLGVDRAHVVGYDVGGLVALQLALDAPGLVHTLALLEPLLMEVPSGPDVAPGVVPALDAYQAGDPAGAVRILVELGGGPESAAVLARCLPNALERAARDAATFFEEEFLAIATWEMDDAGWNRIYQPMLSVLGEHSLPFFAEGREVLRSNCFDVENFDLFNTSHLLQIENPEGTAAGLRSFFSRHPMR